MNYQKFRTQADISHKSRLVQAVVRPVPTIPLFIISRLAKLFNVPVNLSTKTFWGQAIEGIIPDPNFSFIYLYGFLDEGITTMLLKYLRPGMTVIDVGAHIGYETLLAAKIIGKEGKVYSFEPTPSTYNMLYKNTRGSENVIINNMAVWSKNTFLSLFDYGYVNSGLNSFFKPRMTKNDAGAINYKSVKVPTISLDNYFSLYGIGPDFVKIDAESAEYNVLVGMVESLKRDKPIVVIEIGDTPSETGKTEKCIRFLENFGYQTMECVDGQVRVHKLRGDYLGVYDNLLFLPAHA